MFFILAGPQGRDITDTLEAVLLVVATEVDVDTVTYLDAGAAGCTEEDVDMEDASINKDRKVVAGKDTPVVTGSDLLIVQCTMPLLFKLCPQIPNDDVRFPPRCWQGASLRPGSAHPWPSALPIISRPKSFFMVS